MLLTLSPLQPDASPRVKSPEKESTVAPSAPPPAATAPVEKAKEKSKGSAVAPPTPPPETAETKAATVTEKPKDTPTPPATPAPLKQTEVPDESLNQKETPAIEPLKQEKIPDELLEKDPDASAPEPKQQVIVPEPTQQDIIGAQVDKMLDTTLGAIPEDSIAARKLAVVVHSVTKALDEAITNSKNHPSVQAKLTSAREQLVASNAVLESLESQQTDLIAKILVEQNSLFEGMACPIEPVPLMRM